jgi:hypothetical protein
MALVLIATCSATRHSEESSAPGWWIPHARYDYQSHPAFTLLLERDLERHVARIPAWQTYDDFAQEIRYLLANRGVTDRSGCANLTSQQQENIYVTCIYRIAYKL